MKSQNFFLKKVEQKNEKILGTKFQKNQNFFLKKVEQKSEKINHENQIFFLK